MVVFSIPQVVCLQQLQMHLESENPCSLGNVGLASRGNSCKTGFFEIV